MTEGGGTALTEATGFTLRLQEDEDISLTDGSDDVSDQGTALVLALLADELDTALGDTTTGTGTAKGLDDTSVFNSIL